MPEKLNRIHEVAARLDCCERTVRGLIARGDLEAIRIGRSVRISDEAMEQYIASRGKGGQVVANSRNPS